MKRVAFCFVLFCFVTAPWHLIGWLCIELWLCTMMHVGSLLHSMRLFGYMCVCIVFCVVFQPFWFVFVFVLGLSFFSVRGTPKCNGQNKDKPELYTLQFVCNCKNTKKKGKSNSVIKKKENKIFFHFCAQIRYVLVFFLLCFYYLQLIVNMAFVPWFADV